MKIFQLSLSVLATFLLFGCRKHEGASKSDGLAMPIEAPAREREEGIRRLTDLDLAVSLWYSEQGGAAMVIQPFVNIDIKPVMRDRWPLEILKERREIIDSEPRVIDQSEPDLAQALKMWWKHQKAATDALREVLGKELSPIDQDAPRGLLDEQEHLLKEIQKEREVLSRKLGVE